MTWPIWSAPSSHLKFPSFGHYHRRPNKIHIITNVSNFGQWLPVTTDIRHSSLAAIGSLVIAWVPDSYCSQEGTGLSQFCAQPMISQNPYFSC